MAENDDQQMANDARGAGDPAGPEEGYLFSDAGLKSPLEELRSIFEKRFRTAQNLGEEEKARLFQAAHELARKRLAASLGEEPS